MWNFLWSNANGMAVALRQALQRSGSTACGKNARSGQWLIGGMTSVFNRLAGRLCSGVDSDGR